MASCSRDRHSCRVSVAHGGIGLFLCPYPRPSCGHNTSLASHILLAFHILPVVDSDEEGIRGDVGDDVGDNPLVVVRPHDDAVTWPSPENVLEEEEIWNDALAEGATWNGGCLGSGSEFLVAAECPGLRLAEEESLKDAGGEVCVVP